MKNFKKCCYSLAVLAGLFTCIGTIYLLAYTHGYHNDLKGQMINSTTAVSAYENGPQALMSKEKPHVRRELELPKDECDNHCVSSWYRDAFTATLIISLVSLAGGLCCL